MLNRKASNYIYYGTLIGIALIILLVRVSLLGNLLAKTEDVERHSQLLQFQIDQVDEIVASNRYIQQDDLYELYRHVPVAYDDDLLVDYVTAQLELVGVTKDKDVGRDVDVDVAPNFHRDSIFFDLQEDFHVVKVEVEFNIFLSVEDVEIGPVETPALVQAFIDAIQDSEQVFIISNVTYSQLTGSNTVLVQIDFLAFYEN